jgi:hypothetical protein
MASLPLFGGTLYDHTYHASDATELQSVPELVHVLNQEISD